MSMQDLAVKYNVAHVAYKEKEAQWARDFKLNHRAFAEKLADRIAMLAFNEFVERSRDHKYQPLSISYPQIFCVSMDASRSKDILAYMEGEALLAPFNDWLTLFNDKNPEPKQFVRGQERRIDYYKFSEQMTQVGTLTAARVNEQLVKIVAQAENTGLNFSAKWIPSSIFRNPSSDASDNCVEIQFWLGDLKKKPSTEEVALLEERKIAPLNTQSYRSLAVVACLVAVLGCLTLALRMRNTPVTL